MITKCPICKRPFKFYQYKEELICSRCLDPRHDNSVSFGINEELKELRCFITLENGEKIYLTYFDNMLIIYRMILYNGHYTCDHINETTITSENFYDQLIIDDTLYEQICSFAEKVIKLQVFL